MRLVSAKRIPNHHGSGYTLLEILFVLALFGLIASLAIPRLTALYERVRVASQRDEVLEQIAGLGLIALREGKTFEIPGVGPDPSAQEESSKDEQTFSLAEPAPLEIPEGWRLSAEASIRFYDNGACSGGRLWLEYEGNVIEVLLRPPLCRPEIAS